MMIAQQEAAVNAAATSVSEGAAPGPRFFIVGCPRSGTTLLQWVVNAHPQIAMLPEMHWITDPFSMEPGRPLQGCVTSTLVEEWIAHKRFAHLEMPPGEFRRLIEPEGEALLDVFVTRLFEAYGRLRGKPLVGNKTPLYVEQISSLHAQWPDAKFVHLIRDGRDNWLSIQSWRKADRTAGRFVTWSEDPLTTTALWWRRKVLLGQEAGQQFEPERYCEVRYEEFVANPAAGGRALCAFLRVPFDEAMLRHHVRTTVAEPGSTTARARSVITPGLRDWRTQMTAEEVEKFEAAAGELLAELGYPRAFPSPGPEALAHAARIKEQFTRDARVRGRALPEGW
jgi:hypothetical protein